MITLMPLNAKSLAQARERGTVIFTIFKNLCDCETFLELV